MGCEQSTPEKVIPPKSGTKANGSSSAGSSHSAHRNRHADKAHVEALTAFAKDWAARRGLDDKDFDVNSIIADCSSYFRAWPRGDKAGMFLHAPVASGLPLPERGVALSWLNEAWNRIKAEAGKGSIPTRAFVEFFVRPLLLDHAADVTLFDFVPLAFRAKPYVYLSHSWDGWLRQAFFLPEATVRDWPENAAVWMDVFAINQVEDIPRNFMVKEIGQVVASIANTLLVLPGDGMPSFALLPAMRSWCMYEMAMTPANCMSYRMGMHGDLGDAEFHEKILASIESVTCKAAQASFAQDKAIVDEIMENEPGGLDAVDLRIRAYLRQAFAERYAAVTSPPRLGQTGKAPSLSDYYSPPPVDKDLDGA